MTDKKNGIAVVLKGYPRLSETFIAQEILGLEKQGLDLTLISLRHPTDKTRHPIHDEIKAPVHYLPEYVWREPLRVFRGWWWSRKQAGYKAALAAFIKDFRRDFTFNRMRRFGQALVLARELSPRIGWLYAHFLHTPASVTRYGAAILGMGWSCSAHAKDIWTSPKWELSEKLDDMAWLATCTKTNVDYLKSLCRYPERVELVYHGLDFSRFPDGTQTLSNRNGGQNNDPVVILSVGRAVEKKGYDVLLDAFSRLPADLNWEFSHIGGGDDLEKLQILARDLGLDKRITWLGTRPQTEVLKAYRQADIFVLASIIGQNGDRDGLPNVLMEAQSQGIACISTAISAIPELIIDGETGLLVEQNDAAGLALALQKLIIDPALRQRMGSAGHQRVRTHFSCEQGIERLATWLQKSVQGG